MTATQEDRSGWVPPYRIRETREQAYRQAQTEFQAQQAQLQAEYERVQGQLRALVGVQAPENPEVSQIRKQFGELFPKLARFENLDPERLEALLDQASNFENSTQHYWQQYGIQALSNLYKTAEDSLGAPLTPDGKALLHSQFLGWVSATPERGERYAQDPSIINDFWKEITSNLIDPVRRSATATVAGRVPTALPQDRPGGAVPTAPAPKYKDLDERTAAGWQRFVAEKQGGI